jgi:hypothetical protein
VLLRLRHEHEIVGNISDISRDLDLIALLDAMVETYGHAAQAVTHFCELLFKLPFYAFFFATRCCQQRMRVRARSKDASVASSVRVENLPIEKRPKRSLNAGKRHGAVAEQPPKASRAPVRLGRLRCDCPDSSHKFDMSTKSSGIFLTSAGISI